MKFWMLVYASLTLFDVILTYFFVSSGQFGIEDEANSLIRLLMEKYGIWQGLSIYVIQEFLMFFLMWGCFYYILKQLIKNRSELLQQKVDLLIFNMGIPFIIIASALLHLFGGIAWLFLGVLGIPEPLSSLKLIIYTTIFCGLLQCFYAYKLNLELMTSSEQLYGAQ